MKHIHSKIWAAAGLIFLSCTHASRQSVRIVQTSRSGDRLTDRGTVRFSDTRSQDRPVLHIDPDRRYQEIVGFGGAFTESSASVLNRMSDAKRSEIIQNYFGPDGAAYSLTRTHINSCDFSLSTYAYAMEPGDTALQHFSIQEDMDDLIPFIRDAMRASKDGFRVLASPWTAPPWMKDNGGWYGGALKKEYYPTWALYFSKTIRAYKAQGIPIWGVTVENEPLGNGGQWESMIFTPETQAEFVRDHLGPRLRGDGLDVKILIYDQNRDHLPQWMPMLDDPDVARYVWGAAVHWYSSTVDWYPENLNAAHAAHPNKKLMHTEGCIDNIGNDEPQGAWLEDDWYWSRQATDWGYYWAAEQDRDKHPKYVPVYRYARDIIGGLNSWLTGWIDWNMVLDFRGGPNHAQNWCAAPVLADPETDTVYYTPLHSVMAHFSKHIRPGAVRIGVPSVPDGLMAAACLNPDGSVAVAVLNRNKAPAEFQIRFGNRFAPVSIPDQAIQTLVIQ